MDEQYAFAENMIEAAMKHSFALQKRLEHETLDAKQVFDLIEGKPLAPRVPSVTKNKMSKKNRLKPLRLRLKKQRIPTPKLGA